MSDIKLHVLGQLLPFERERFDWFEDQSPRSPLGQRLLYALGASRDPFGESVAYSVNISNPDLWKRDEWWDLWNVVHNLPWRVRSLDDEDRCSLRVCIDYFDWLAEEEGYQIRRTAAFEALVSDALPGIRTVLPYRG